MRKSPKFVAVLDHERKDYELLFAELYDHVIDLESKVLTFALIAEQGVTRTLIAAVCRRADAFFAFALTLTYIRS